ncbi:MAG: hypothetical protein KBD15_03090 [Candidatus Magasanikbacteria bacterium]|jgi:hypothetical protein|nr:hypothetical protein [Candidatus Magasanikbacteria bacterium]
MQHKTTPHSFGAEKNGQDVGNTLVCMYLLAGITLLVAVFLFLPRVSLG